MEGVNNTKPTFADMSGIELLSTAHATYEALHNSGNTTVRKSTATIAKLGCGARIVVKLPRANDTTFRLKVGFSKDVFSIVHWTGSISGFASSPESTIAELKYVLLALANFKLVNGRT